MRKIFLFLALLVTIAGNAFAQDSGLTGYVYDVENGDPIIGATVKVDGSKIVTVTDVDGKFTLNGLQPKNKRVTVTYVGYAPNTVDIKEGMKVYLTSSTDILDEVIVVAFGKQKRESFTGSATVVSAEDITRQQVTNPIEALNGRVSGLQMTQTNSFTSNPEIIVRGIGSINASRAPLVVVDGMPYSGAWNDINPADIENITVLKDAASNALYGARGANGVIMITTKTAKRGATKVDFDAKWGSNHDARVHYDYIDNAGEYYEAHYLALRNYYQYDQQMSRQQAHILANNSLGANADNGGLGYMVYAVPENQFLIGENGRVNPAARLGNRVAYDNQFYMLYPDNWTDEGTRNGFRQEYNLNITGGNEKYNMIASLGYLSDEGIAYGTDIERYTARLKANYQAYDFLRMGANAGYTHTKSNTQGAVFSALYDVAPVYPLYIRDDQGNILTDSHGKRFDYGNRDNAGMLRPTEIGGNPIQDDIINVNSASSNAYNMQGFATADFLNDFHATINGSVYITEWRSVLAYNPYFGFTKETGGSTDVSHDRNTSLNFQQLLDWNHSFGLHTLDVLVGHEYSKELASSLYGSRTQVANFGGNTELNGAVVNGSNGSSKAMYNVEGYFARAQYDYDNKIFGSASFRRDGSSRFDVKHRWGNFWSVGGAWIISKENWFPKSNLLNMLKLKASYGQQGNDGIGSFRYVDLYNITNSSDKVSFIFNDKGNPDITWETVGSFNAGIEFELFNNRLRGGVEFYSRTTSDMLLWFTAPYEIGYSGYYDNVGDMNNKGIEIELSADLIQTKNFNWNVALNTTWERNRVTYLPEENKGANLEGHPGFVSGNYFWGEDLPAYTWRLKRTAGVDKTNGHELWYKTGANGELTTTTRYDDADYYNCGSALPKLFGGFTTSFKVFDFDLTAQFNYSIGGKKWDYTYQWLMYSPMPAATGTGYHRDAFRAWTPENPESDIPMWTYNNTYTSINSLSDRYLMNGSYFSFKNITMGYTLPQALTRRFHVERLRVFASCDGVAYWTKRKGFDPRQGLTDSAIGNYSPMRTISGGLQIQF